MLDTLTRTGYRLEDRDMVFREPGSYVLRVRDLPDQERPRERLLEVGPGNLVHPREVFQPAIEHGAVAIILAHNHPSGRLEGTTADIKITEQLVKAGDVLGIELLDHLVITPNRFTGLMDTIDRQA